MPSYSQVNFHYTGILFSLKKAGANYQLAMIAIFHDMLHDCLEDYIYEFFMKSKEEHLQKPFIICKWYNLQMNPLKFGFDVTLGKNLGFTTH